MPTVIDATQIETPAVAEPVDASQLAEAPVGDAPVALCSLCYAGMILPLLVDAAGVFIMKNFFDSIPVAVEEAARIDGAGTFRIFWSIVLPMARPALVTLIILSFQGSWNEYSHFIVSAQSTNLFTLTKGVGQFASGGLSAGNQFPIKLGAAAIMTIPVAMLFFVFRTCIAAAHRDVRR